MFRQGVNAILIADNMSADETPNILRRLAQQYPLFIARDMDPAHEQALKMDILANVARSHGARWIIPFDADELWFSESTTVAEFLQSCRAEIVTADMYNVFPDSSEAVIGDDHWRMQVEPHIRHKVAFRTHLAANLAAGNHDVERPGETVAGLHIAHVPWRSYGQFRRKALNGATALSATQLGPDCGFHWRYLGSLDADDSHAVWQSIITGRAVDNIEWAPTGPGVPTRPWDWEAWQPPGPQW